MYFKPPALTKNRAYLLDNIKNCLKNIVKIFI